MDKVNTGREQGDRAQLTLDGVETPIVTRVRETRARGMTVEQSLPFLRLHTGVLDAASNRSHIESVSLVVSDGVPRLVLDLAYDDAVDMPSQGPDPVLAPGHPRNPLAGVSRARRRDETLEYDTPSSDSAEHAEGVADASEHATGYVGELDPDGPPREPTQVFATHAAAADEPARQQSAELTLEEQLFLSAKPSYRLAQRWARVEPVLRRAAGVTREYTVRFARWTAPRLLRLARALGRGGGRIFAAARNRILRPAKTEG